MPYRRRRRRLVLLGNLFYCSHCQTFRQNRFAGAALNCAENRHKLYPRLQERLCQKAPAANWVAGFWGGE